MQKYLSLLENPPILGLFILEQTSVKDWNLMVMKILRHIFIYFNSHANLLLKYQTFIFTVQLSTCKEDTQSGNTTEFYCVIILKNNDKK